LFSAGNFSKWDGAENGAAGGNTENGEAIKEIINRTILICFPNQIRSLLFYMPQFCFFIENSGSFVKMYFR
jgi:hypothetical protein